MIEQFLQEQGYHASLSALEKESGQIANFVTDKKKIEQAIVSGAWDQVLGHVSSISLSHQFLSDLYEHVCFIFAINFC